jgi:peptidoglycan biosynthesis protein MviN/MurJ (putative lipid II flippase)
MSDSGASPERTRLAWRRTVLTGTAAALLALRPAFADPGRPELLAASGAMAGFVALVALSYRRSRGLKQQPPQPGRRTVVACALVTVGLAIIGGLVVTL